MKDISEMTELEILQEIKSVNQQGQTLQQRNQALNAELKKRVDQADETTPRAPAPEQTAFMKEAMDRIANLEKIHADRSAAGEESNT